MKKTETNKTSSDAAKIAVIGASIAGLAATAYFFLGPNAKKHQKNVKAWAIKMKGDVIEKLETAKEVSEPTYQAIIDTIALKYQKGSKVNVDDVKELANNLKKQWKTIRGEVKSVKNNVAKGVKKATKKLTK